MGGAYARLRFGSGRYLHTNVHEHIRRRVALLLKYWQSRRAKFCAAIIVGIVARIIVQPRLRGTFFRFAEVRCRTIGDSVKPS